LVLGLILWQTGVFKPKTIVVSTIEYKEETILPDNTSVYLNNNTQLAFSKKLKKKKIRKVKLSGEAFFNVEPNANKPFVIYTHDVKIEVIGTSFNVRSYPDEATEVTVKSGVVKVTQLNKVEDVNEPVVLKKGDKVAIDTINFANAAQVNDNPNYLSWKTESYAFDSVSINKVMETLQRGFDTTIVVKNPDFNDCMLVAKFDSLYLNEIFWILQRTYNISVKRSNDTIYIDGKGCK
jgi:transmembrane sensor